MYWSSSQLIPFSWIMLDSRNFSLRNSITFPEDISSFFDYITWQIVATTEIFNFFWNWDLPNKESQGVIFLVYLISYYFLSQLWNFCGIEIVALQRALLTTIITCWNIADIKRKKHIQTAWKWHWTGLVMILPHIMISLIPAQIAGHWKNVTLTTWDVLSLTRPVRFATYRQWQYHQPWPGDHKTGKKLVFYLVN